MVLALLEGLSLAKLSTGTWLELFFPRLGKSNIAGVLILGIGRSMAVKRCRVCKSCVLCLLVFNPRNALDHFII